MQKSDFNKLSPFFDADENWGEDLEKVQWFHVHHLWLIRRAMIKEGKNWPMIIHCCYEKDGHSTNSCHYKGTATDFHFDRVKDIDIRTQLEWLISGMINCGLDQFMSVGIYPQWNNPGFHLDSRGEALRWVKINGVYHYSIDSINKYLR
jgi:hypothetical protein